MQIICWWCLSARVVLSYLLALQTGLKKFLASLNVDRVKVTFQTSGDKSDVT